jgi:phosphohistidine swiveling domain-containing protein
MFKTLSEIADVDAPRVGGKALNCARLRRAGFPVPDGLVITADAADSEIGQVAEQPWFRNLPATETFAVRSSGVDEDSAGHSFAGVHETLLNVARDGLLDAVHRCRVSAGSRQAATYRQARGVEPGRLAIAVLIQRMVPAHTSGVAFTVNPATGADEIVVNSAYGLGDAIVSGQIDPDEFILSKQDGEVRSSRIGATTEKGVRPLFQASLTPEQIHELGRLLVRIEREAGVPQDVEWCHDGASFWIVQARPVTTARASSSNPESRIPNPEPSPNPESRIPNPEWTRANVAEVLPDQMSPQAMSLFERVLDAAERRFFGRLFAPESELGPVVKVFHGRMYFNLSQLRRVAAIAGAPAAELLRSFGHSEQIAAEDEVPAPIAFSARVRVLPDLVRAGINDARMASLMRRHEERVEQEVARLTSVDPRTLSDRDIWQTVEWWANSVPGHIRIVFVVASVFFRESSVRKICRRIGFPYERLVYPVLAAGARSVSTQQAVDLVQLSGIARDEPRTAAYLEKDGGAFTEYRAALQGTAFLKAFDDFLSRYGHRGRYESDWAIPRYHENPAPLLFAVRSHLDSAPQDSAVRSQQLADDAAAAWRDFTARLSSWQRLTLLPRARSLLKRLKQQYVWREQVRSDLTRVLAAMRPWHLVLAQRFVERGWLDRRDDYFLLTLEEVGRTLADDRVAPALRAIAQRRTDERSEQRPLRMPLLMRESELPALLQSAPTSLLRDEQRLSGLCVSPGAAEGEVVVMRDPDEFGQMKRGAILVAPATDPSWTPLFTLAAGVIVEVGGMLSHASTIAREYGLPALANVKDATRILRTGDVVKLDATAGYVERTRA